MRRYNRSKGYGVHSPFAFNFIRRVLREECPYYAYNDIKEHRRNAKTLTKNVSKDLKVISYRNAKMLFRIACYFSPSMVLQLGTTYGVSTTTLLEVAATTKIVLYPGENTHDDTVYRTITKRFSNRIATTGSLAEAIDDYGAIKGGQSGFLLINIIDAKDYELTKSLINSTVGEGGVIIMRNLSHSTIMRQLWRECVGSMTYGMTFSNYRIGVIVALKHLPHQNFKLWF